MKHGAYHRAQLVTSEGVAYEGLGRTKKAAEAAARKRAKKVGVTAGEVTTHKFDAGPMPRSLK